MGSIWFQSLNFQMAVKIRNASFIQFVKATETAKLSVFVLNPAQTLR